VTALSLAGHDAEEHLRRDPGADGHAGVRQRRRLMWETVAARRALADPEQARAGLPAYHFGRCERCATVDQAGTAAARRSRNNQAHRRRRQPAGGLGYLSL
jgi:hypothetical protein